VTGILTLQRSVRSCNVDWCFSCGVLALSGHKLAAEEFRHRSCFGAFAGVNFRWLRWARFVNNQTLSSFVNMAPTNLTHP